ncbi:MAG: RnfABCDGE type electron transport complex subunit G [Lachnospiraceae bacterium]|nr:RnfABCDGE type electron transport complex subunit G [Lachnospiraceae bacterium]MDD7027610.1 RnfABCDGE type electron transport complex subunit G [Lachnospiraceae bacterium]MDY5701620.1 RnfABCDGE type electron transport complex subunit G [Lachnospiraceae bacterium]
MKNMLKDAVILFAITLIAGLFLGVVYDVTKDPIAAQKIKKKNEACQEVFADAATFQPIEVIRWDTEEEPKKEEVDAASSATVLGGSGDIDAAYEALSAQGELLGYVLEVTTHGGYNGDIQFSMGIRLDGTVNGISLLSIAETPGLGMQAEEVLKPQFAGKQAKQFEYTKVGAVTDNQIDAISGATITTSAVVDGVNTGLSYFYNELGGGK